LCLEIEFLVWIWFEFVLVFGSGWTSVSVLSVL